MNEARAAVESNGLVYTITSGGMFSSSNDGEVFETLTPSDGLSSIDLRAVTAGEDGFIWIGAAGGFIDGYNPDDRSWRRVTDITRTDFTQRDITSLVIRGDTIFVGTGYGISVYSVSRDEFNDSYIKFGQFPTQTPVTSITYDDTYIWVATTLGVARGAIDDPLLVAPDRWTTYTMADNIPASYVNDIILVDATPYIATDDGIAWYDGAAWITIDDFSDSRISEIRSLEYDGDVLYAAVHYDYILDGITRRYDRIYRFNKEGILSQFGPQMPGRVNNLTMTGTGVVAAMNNLGIARLHENNWFTIIPEGPTTNILTHLYVDQESRIWIGTAPAAGRGFYHFDPSAPSGEQWKSYRLQQYSELRSNNYYRMAGARDGTVWASSWGGGITAVHPDGTLRNYYLDDGLVPIKGSTSFVVTSKAAEDDAGNIWFTLYNMADDEPLVKLNPETSELTTYRNFRNPSALQLRDVIVDRFNTVWIISEHSTALGGQNALFYFNEHESIGQNVNGWGVLTTANGLPSNTIGAVVEDNRGEIWIGTGQGLAAISNPREPQASVRDIFVLQEQSVNTLAVDPLNRKWVGTREGVFLLSPDGTQLLAHYNVRNTNNKLLSDDVLSIAFDDNTGIVYFGSGRGISSLQTVAAAPRAAFGELFISPNPYRIPADHQLKIDGLVRNALIKIISVDGRLVRSFNSPGGRVAHWDGLDDSGRMVASGVYIVVGISEDRTEVGRSKVTVIRR